MPAEFSHANYNCFWKYVFTFAVAVKILMLTKWLSDKHLKLFFIKLKGKTLQKTIVKYIGREQQNVHSLRLRRSGSP